MAAKPAPGSAGVDALLAATEHPLKPVMEEVRRTFVGADPLVTEQVKWNSLSLCHRGEDRLTFNVRPEKPLIFVFHRGARAKEDGDFAFDDPHGLMTWPGKDRALVTVTDLADWQARKAEILALIPSWFAATDESA